MSLMVLGTASHVGKSTVVAAICRAMVNRGVSVAPFKSQNMSLNSDVTGDGGEIGIAQAVQAAAAYLEPEVEMNPVLLKPKGDGVSQVVLLGRPYKDLPIAEYYKETDYLLSVALDAASRLRRRHGHLVVEGAGGAAELNLYDRDIANIRLAKTMRLPIVLVADIERGGVFAQVYGTINLLPDDVRPLVRGVIVNKFRGDMSLFYDGVKMLEEITGVPVLGVLPFIDIGLPSEDSLSIGEHRSGGHGVRIGVIRFPHISNFTDFALLERHASVEYVPLGAPLEGFDCIILPGTKNTVADLQLLMESRTRDEILSARERGVPIIGICGGYQMLGREIVDAGTECAEGKYPGLGLLDGTTEFSAYRKHTVRVQRAASDIPPILGKMHEVSGYEIHMGETDRGSDREALEGDGAVSRDGLVIGTYMHGLFQNPSAADALVSFLAQRKGAPHVSIAGGEVLDPFDELAEVFEAHVDMAAIASFFL